MNDEGEKDLELTSQMEGMFNKLGISVYKSNGTLKNTYEILDTLAPVYQKATAEEKAYITETIAGKYQAQNAAAILNNFSTAIEANETALNSQGSASRENAKVLDSVQGKVKALQSAWEELSKNALNSGFLKFILDIGTAFLNVANSGFGSWVAKSGLIFASLKILYSGLINASAGFERLKTTLITAKTQISILKDSYGSLGSVITFITNKQKIQQLQQEVSLVMDKKKSMSLKEIKASMEAYGIAVDTVKTKEQAKIAIDKAAAASSLALNLALAGIGLIIGGVISGVSAYNQKQEELRQDALDSANSLDEENKSLSTSIEQIQNYRGVLSDVKSSEEDITNAKKGLKDIQEELIKTYGKEAEGLDLVNGKLDEQIKKIDEAARKKADKWLSDMQDQILKAKKKTKEQVDLGATYYKGELLGNRVNLYSSDAMKYIEKFGTNKGFDVNLSPSNVLFGDMNAEESLEFLRSLSEELRNNKQAALDAGMSEKEYTAILSEVSTAINQVKDKYGDYIKIRDKEKQKTLEATDGYNSFIRQIQEMGSQGQLTEDSYNKLLESFPKVKDALKGTGKDFDDFKKKYQDDTVAIENFKKELEENPALEKAAEKIKELGNAGELSKEKVEELVKKFPELKEVIDEYFDDEDIGKKISDVFNVDITKGPADILSNYGSQIDDITEKYNILTSAVDEWNNAGYISAETMKSLTDNGLLQYLDEQNGKLIANTNELYNQAEANRADASQALTNAMVNDVLKVAEGDVKNASDLAQRAVAALGDNATAAGNKAASQVGNFVSFAQAVDKANQALAGKNLTKDTKNKINAVIEGYKGSFQALSKPIKVSPVSYTGSGGSGRSGGSGGSGGSGRSGRSGGSSSSKTTKAWWETQFDKLKNKFKYNEITIESYISSLNSLLKKVKKGSDAWKQINEELQKQRLAKVEDDYKRGAISLSTYISKLKELAKAYKKGTEAYKDLADKIKSALIDKAEEQEDKYNTALDAAIDIIDREIDALDKLRDEQEEYYDKLIEDKEKANDETERELELARLQEALANARNEKTKRVWREGLGWVWESDTEAIKEAEEELAEFQNEQEIENLEKQKDEALKAIDDQIEAWEDYKDEWDKVIDDYEASQDRLVLAQQLGANAEADILNQRLATVDNFAKKYIATMEELKALENTVSTNLVTSSVKKPAAKGRYTIKAGETLSDIASRYGITTDELAKYNNISSPNLIYTGQQINIPGYSNGGIIDYTGLAMVHGSKNNPEFMMNNEQMKNLFINMIRPRTSSNLLSGQCGEVNTYNFGNIELPNVHNVKQFTEELKSLVNITKHK